MTETTKTTDHGSDGSDNTSWSSETTWVITSGSLENSFTFDSSDDCPPDSPTNSTPLLLNPPSHDSGPCEIKLYFSQKYTIRQIYVRSTARVYEVYHSQSPHGASEYLCTARCCIAERDDGVLQAKFAKSLTETETSDGEFGEESSANSEDDWVDVEVVGSRLSDNRSLALLNETKCHIKEVVQDYYEATVEINDSEPCASVTIRFLSLQSRECVLIDEIYIFAELVGPIESESSAPYAASSSGSSLMAMLLPTLLQLSKSRSGALQADQVSDNLGKVNEVEILSIATEATDATDAVPQVLQGEQSKEDLQYVKLKDSERLGKVNKVGILSRETDLTDTVSEISQDEKSNADNQSVKLQKLDKDSLEPVISGHQNQDQDQDHCLAGDESSFDPGVTHSPPHGRIEEVLEQLVSRVSRIEEVCLRFEENILKPLNRMEMRIQRVEEQLESLTKSPQGTGLPTGTSFVAPSFSCGTNSSSISKDGSDSVSSRKIPELDKNESDASIVLSNPSEVILESLKAPCFLPSLVVTAPDFSCDEDDEDELEQDDSATNLPKGSSEGKSKRLIDDILAAALSNFLLPPSDNPSECKQTDKQCNGVQAIDSVESSQAMETLANDGIARDRAYEDPPKYTQILTVKAPEFTLEETDSDQCIDHLQLPSEAASATTAGEHLQVPLSPTSSGSFAATLELSLCDENKSPLVYYGCGSLQPGHSDLLVRSASFSADQSEDLERTDYCKAVDESGQSSYSILFSSRKNATEQNFCSDAVKAVAVAEGSDKVFESQTASSEDDMAWANVKFTSHANSSSQLPLEALLGGVSIPELNFTANSSGGNFVHSGSDETIDYVTSSHLLVDLGIFDYVSNSAEESEFDNHSTSSSNSKPEIVASLI